MQAFFLCPPLPQSFFWNKVIIQKEPVPIFREGFSLPAVRSSGRGVFNYQLPVNQPPRLRPKSFLIQIKSCRDSATPPRQEGKFLLHIIFSNDKLVTAKL
jgi:hypothetical protein